MLKRPITYVDFDGNSQTEVFYFNLTQTELMEMELDYDNGLAEALQAIVATNDSKLIYNEFKKLILNSYGEKSSDGKRHVKSEELKVGFSQTAAFDALIIEFYNDPNVLVEFIKGALPAKMQEAIAAADAERAAEAAANTLPPPVPANVNQ